MAVIKRSSSLTMAEAFDSFIFSKSAQGVTDKTIECYRSHFKCISKYLDTTIQLSSLKKETTYKMIADMRTAKLSSNTIASYVRVLKTFLSWARSEGLCNVSISNYKTEETIKETYSDSELAVLLKKINGYGKCPYCSPRKTRARRVLQVETGRSFKTLKEAAMKRMMD